MNYAKPFSKNSLDRRLIEVGPTPKSHVPESLEMEGGTVKGKDGLLIDGKLTKCHIVSTDGSVIHFSAMSRIENCTIDGNDVLFEGPASGEFKVKGNCEISESATMMGRLEVAGDTFISRLADKQDLRIFSLKVEEASQSDSVQQRAVSLVAAA